MTAIPASPQRQLFAWQLNSLVSLAKPLGGDEDLEIIFCGQGASSQDAKQALPDDLAAWQKQGINLDENDVYVLSAREGPLLLCRPKAASPAQLRDQGLLAPSLYSAARDTMGKAFAEVKKLKPQSLSIRWLACRDEEKLGALVGLDLASYSYRSSQQDKLGSKVELYVDIDPELAKQATALSQGINCARHLVNSPPNVLFPEAMADALKRFFQYSQAIEIRIWDEERLKKEKMGLMLAVGGGSAQKPCLVHLRYRPEQANRLPPLALIGKGVTFDCGGLDIKDAAGMRLMKKDMGGAAALVGLLHWAEQTSYHRGLDIYLPLAENAISATAYRPSDIIQARNGKSVEIHNTDAEGRLILADAISLAAEALGDDKPEALLIVATLTGAIKIGLGADIAGFFSNSDALAELVSSNAQRFGDGMWRMPLFDGYRSRLDTNVADINHCATGTYGGAITAALFLNEFAKNYPFTHMDIFAWNESERGALREVGGSGQSVQCLAGVLKQLENKRLH